MTFLPFETITYRTNLSEEEVMRRLASEIEPKQFVRVDLLWRRPAKPYEGELIGNTFRINRIIRYRNSFLPKIDGVVERDREGTIVEVTIKTSLFLTGFFSLCFGVVGWLTNIGRTTTLTANKISLTPLIPIGMAFFAYIVAMAAFTYESNQAKKDLQRIVEGERMDENIAS